MEALQYPIGRFEFDEQREIANRENLIEQLATFPERLKSVLQEITEIDYAKTYRPNGWNIRQLVHHLSDSHTNMYIRVKSAIARSENNVVGYDEATWAEFSDNALPLEISLKMLESIHAKIAYLLQNLPEEKFMNSYFHLGEKRLFTINEVIGLYVWHGNHHLKHIKIAARN